MFTAILSKLSATATSQWAAQLELSTSLNKKMLDSMTKLAELNIHSAQDTFAASSQAVRQMLTSGKTASATDIVAPIDRMRAYGRDLNDIASGMRTEYLHLMQESVQAAQAVAASVDGGAHPFAPPPSKAAKRAHAH